MNRFVAIVCRRRRCEDGSLACSSVLLVLCSARKYASFVRHTTQFRVSSNEGGRFHTKIDDDDEVPVALGCLDLWRPLLRVDVAIRMTTSAFASCADNMAVSKFQLSNTAKLDLWTQ